MYSRGFIVILCLVLSSAAIARPQSKPRERLLEQELQMRRRAEIISQKILENNLARMGVDSETCQLLSDPTKLTETLKRQLEELRARGELIHCEGVAQGRRTIELERELEQTPLPAPVTGTDAPIPTKPMTEPAPAGELTQRYITISRNKTPMVYVDEHFKQQTATHFAGFEMASEGMAALRHFYSGETSLNGDADMIARNPTHQHFPECRIIVSGEIEFTGAVTTDERALDRHPSCASACKRKIRTLIAEKPQAAFMMSCHHLGEVVAVDSRGGPAPEKPVLGTCEIIEAKPNVLVQASRPAEKLLDSFEVRTKSECYRRFKDLYFELEARTPLFSEVTQDSKIYESPRMEIKALINKEPLVQSQIHQFFNAPPKAHGQGGCLFEMTTLHKSLERTQDSSGYSESAMRANGETCEKACQRGFKQFITNPPSGRAGYMVSGNPKFTRDWHFRCKDAGTRVYMDCTKDAPKGCK